MAKRLATAILLAVAAAGMCGASCGHASDVTRTRMTNSTPDGSPSSPTDAKVGCAAALHDLSIGEYSGFHGLGDDCTSASARQALGVPEPGGDMTGSLGGSPTRYRIYLGSDASPQGVYIWDVDDRIVLVRIHGARPARPITDQLGEPEARDPSRMPGFKTQWIWASRGLTLHVDDETGEVAFLYAYRPMTVDEYRASWLSRVEMHRRIVD